MRSNPTRIRIRIRRRAESESGFSFIEILVVMGIIAVLAGLVVVAVGMVAKKKPQIETETRVQKLMHSAQDLKMKWGGTWPPASLTAIQGAAGAGPEIKKVPNTTNLGIEALYQAIYWPGSGLDPQISDAELSNTDEDEMDKAVGRGKTLDEVLDGYGNPIVYFPFSEYATAYEKPHQYVLKNGETVDVRPWKTERGFENPVSCQVFSMGPDGIPNNDDDIKGW